MRKIYKTLICVFWALVILCTLAGCEEDESYIEEGKYYLAETGAYIEIKDIKKDKNDDGKLGTAKLQFVNYDFSYLEDSFYLTDLSEQFSENACEFECYLYEGIIYLGAEVDNSDIKKYLLWLYNQDGVELTDEDLDNIQSYKLTLSLTYNQKNKSLKLTRTDEKFILK